MSYSQSEVDLARENNELREGLKFVQLERDNRTSAYEIGVKLIGELRANNARLRDALENIVALDFKTLESGNRDFYSGAPRFVQAWLICEKALAESPYASLEAIRADAKAEGYKSGYEACRADARFYDIVDSSIGDTKPGARRNALDAHDAIIRQQCGRDTERLDLLEQHCVEMHCFTCNPDYAPHPTEWVVGKNPEFGWGPRKPTLREAIDGYGAIWALGDAGEK